MSPHPPAEPTGATAGYSRERIGYAVLLLVTCIGVYLCWLLAKPFLTAITWALALAVVGHPLHRYLLRFLNPNLAALVAVIAITLILLAPGVFLLQKVLDEAGDSLAAISRSLNPAALQEVALKYPLAERLLARLGTRLDLNEQLKQLAGAIAGQVPAALSGSVQFLTQSAIMLVTLFYFFRDRGLLERSLIALIPLSLPETAAIFDRISETINATLYGNLVVKIIQGVLGGLMFWILGLPAATFFGAVMALLALLPVAGTSLVWGPAAVYLLLHGSWIKALILVIWGALVVSLIDNFLYPVLLAGKLRFHTLGIMMSIFGGLLAFGIAGVVLGPLILAVTMELLEVWRVRTQRVQQAS